MKKWCKIFEIEGYQVLFFYELDSSYNGPKENNYKGDYYTVHQIVNIDDVWADIKVQGITEDKIEKVFDAVSEKEASLVFEVVGTLLKEKQEDDNF